MTLALLDHADALSVINADTDVAVARDVSGALAPHAARPDLAHTAHILLPQIIDLHANKAGLITAQWYDDIDPASHFRAKPFADVPTEQVSKIIDWALHAPGEEPPMDRLIGSSQRLVRNASRQTVTGNAAKEGVRWARYAKPTACSFCRALSIRGSGREDRKHLYASDKSAEFRASDGEKYHTHCECEPVPIRAGQVWTPPSYTEDWANQYNEAAKSTKRGDKYFPRVVQKMRENEDAKKAKAVEEKAAADVENLPAPTVLQPKGRPGRLDLLNELQSTTSLGRVAGIADELLPDTTVLLSDEGSLKRLDAGSPKLWDQKAPAVAESLKGVVRGADDILTKYPDLQLNSLVVKHEGSGAYAHASRVRPSGSFLGKYSIVFDDDFIANPAVLHNSWDTAVDTGFHYPGTDNPAYDIIVHEMGHVMQAWAEDTHGVYITSDTVNTALADHFYATNPPGKRTFSTEAYETWLHDNLSGYSSLAGSINPVEALAEAFVDVEINGDDAHETSIVLHSLLVSAYNGVDYMEPERGLPISA